MNTAHDKASMEFFTNLSSKTYNTDVLQCIAVVFFFLFYYVWPCVTISVSSLSTNVSLSDSTLRSLEIIKSIS